jgi:RNA polymerase sigma-70 factor (ECF subfamily)
MTSGELADDDALMALAKRGDGDAFERLAEPHRTELRLHCYRMLGSIHDAEDMVQETLLRAWRGIAAFEERASLRGWLYRIATNVCLDAIERRDRQRRVLPDLTGEPFDRMPDADGALDIAWLEPYPDAALVGVPDSAPTPDVRYELREAVQLAFIAAIQYLPPRQRAALLLRDVLGWSASEVAKLLDASVASVNGALQRARAVIDARLPSRRQSLFTPTASQREVLDRYLHAWERADVDAFVALLREDVVLSMPPWPNWYRGRSAVGSVFAWTARPGGNGPFRLLPTAANGQPAFAFYSRFGGDVWRPHSIQVIELDGDSVASMTSFVTPTLFSAFGLSVRL